MKALLSIIITLIGSAGFAQQSEYIIKGNIHGFEGHKVYLNKTESGSRKVDSTIIKNSEFKFNGTIGSPENAALILDRDGKGLEKMERPFDSKTIWLEPGIIALQAKDSLKSALFTSGDVNKEYVNYIKYIDHSSIQRLSRQKKAAKDKSEINAIQEKINLAMTARRDREINYVRTHPNSFFSLFEISQLSGGRVDVSLIEPLFDGLNLSLKESSKGKEIKQMLWAAKNLVIGGAAPDFTMNDVNDKPVKLSNFRGKYVLLDFWASWCMPCRKDNPNIVSAYNQFKDKNFTVLGVSLDMPGKKQNWLDAIATDGLTWTHVSDLKFWNSEVVKLYGIRGVPMNFLIDPSGKIIAKDLHGEAISKTLSTYFR